MSYTAEISRSNPTALLFLVDQSGSMNDKMSSERSKAQQVADGFLENYMQSFVAKLQLKC